MKGDVLALRAQLEAAWEQAAAAEQRALAARQDEIGQLRATITELREEMIRQREGYLATLQATERDGAAQAEQLRKAIVAARHHADELQRRHDLTLAEQTQRWATERRELHATITELRRRLETTTEDDRR
jgi:N-methylhydantoinase A/oxoprolinase/acetone carboxylase beta subunit